MEGWEGIDALSTRRPHAVQAGAQGRALDGETFVARLKNELRQCVTAFTAGTARGGVNFSFLSCVDELSYRLLVGPFLFSKAEPIERYDVLSP